MRGELVVILAPAGESSHDHVLRGDALDARIRELFAGGKRTKQIRDMLLPETELSSSELYERIEGLKG